jgi:plastocyanin
MRRSVKLAGALAATTLFAAAPAYAADETIQAIDGTAANGFNNAWAPPTVIVAPGDTVTWNFAGTEVAHNVASNSANWEFTSEFHIGEGSESFTFATSGVYQFICDVHPDTMRGTVTVTDDDGNPPDPPDPPGPSEQPWPNPTGPLDSLESGGLDETRPVLRGVRANSRRRSIRVRFRVSERAKAEVRVKRYGITDKHKRIQAAGRETVRFRGLRRGRYRVLVHAVDPAGNRSRTVSRRVRLR